MNHRQVLDCAAKLFVFVCFLKKQYLHESTQAVVLLRHTVVYAFYHLAFLTYQSWVWLSFHHEVTEGQCTNSTGLLQLQRHAQSCSPGVGEKQREKECPRVRLGICGEKNSQINGKWGVSVP